MCHNCTSITFKMSAHKQHYIQHRAKKITKSLTVQLILDTQKASHSKATASTMTETRNTGSRNPLYPDMPNVIFIFSNRYQTVSNHCLKTVIQYLLCQGHWRSILLKNHSVNFRSCAAAVNDSSCSLRLSSLRARISASRAA